MSLAGQIAESFVLSRPREAAAAVEVAKDEDARELLSTVAPAAGSAIIDSMTPWAAAHALGLIPETLAGDIFRELPLDRACRLARTATEPLRNALIATSPPDRQRELQRLLRYPEETAGALMEPRVASFSESTTVSEALAQLQHRPMELRYYAYVVDAEDRLVGVTTLRAMADASDDVELRTIATRAVEKLSARSSGNAIADHPGWRRFPMLPVVDESDRLTGVLRYETFRRLTNEPRTEDDASAVGAMLALGELFWLAASTFVEGGASVRGEMNHTERGRETNNTERAS